MRQIRTLVCDDEPEAREGVLALLQHDPEIAIVGEAGDGREAVTLIEQLRPELVFLDVQMPELDGFGVLAAVPAPHPVVVFVTAYDAYTLRAFEVHALDYLLKPFGDARFAEALGAAKARVHERQAGELGQQITALLQANLGAPGAEPHRVGAPADAAGAAEPSAAERPAYLDRVMVRIARQAHPIKVEDIDWIEADDYYAKLHVAGRSYLVREPMQDLERRLDPKRFIRIHRSTIVNIDRVKLVQPYFHGAHVVTLKDGTRVRLSRSKRAAFERALGGRL